MKADNRIFSVDFTLPSKLRGKGVASSIPEEPNEFVWYPYVPKGELTILAAPGGAGKGLVASDLVARMTRGKAWPLTNECAQVRNVLWFEAEDSPGKTLIPRLTAAGADLDRVKIFTEKEDLKSLTSRQVEDQAIGAIILSPVLSFLNLSNFRDELEVRDALKELMAMIRGLPCGIMGIIHPNKKADLAAIERILGSVAFSNFVRSVLLQRLEEEDTGRLAHGKHNLSVKGNDLIFDIVNRRPTIPRGQHIGIEWSAANENVDSTTMFDRRKVEVDESAAKWLSQHLDDHAWHEFKSIVEAGGRSTHSEDALKQAKNRNPKIKHQTKGFGPKRTTWWRLT